MHGMRPEKKRLAAEPGIKKNAQHPYVERSEYFMKLSNMKRSETTEQILLFCWAKSCEYVLPCLSLLYHVPNEGKRTNGNVLKAAGLKKGVPDICLPVPSKGSHGLYIEMKYGKNKATKEQERYMELLRQQGYQTQVCYGAAEAKEAILAYLQEPGQTPLKDCLETPWADGKCYGVLLPGRMFAKETCRKCEKHAPTKWEEAIGRHMAAAGEAVKEALLKVIADISEGVPMPGLTLEETLEAVNKNLALLVEKKQLQIEGSAAILSIAMEAYERGKGWEK